jgi:DNA invertase Pin-like site-specific DNA recombinase
MATTTAKPTRVAIYGRVSTVNHGQDVGLQVEELRATAIQRGWTIYGEYLDEGISGSKESRPALDRLIADARKGRFDLLVVWKLDPLGRSLQHLLRLLDDLQHMGVGFVSVRDAAVDTTSPQGRLLLQLLGAFAEFERALIQERVKAGVERAQAAGTHCGRPRVDFDVRPAIALLEKGHSLTQVAKMLDKPKTTLRRRLIEAGVTLADAP